MDNAISSNEVIVLRNNSLFRAQIASLSSIFLTKEAVKEILNVLDELSSSITDLDKSFQDHFYSSSEMKSLFSTKENVSMIEESDKYTLINDSTKIADKVQTSSYVLNTWAPAVKNGINSIYSDGIDHVHRMNPYA